jgi:hypothetical protein
MVLTPNDLFSWNNKYSKYTIILSHIHYNEFTSRLPAMNVNSLCACWHSEAVKESSSLSSRRLLISLWVKSPLFLCPELTDAPCPCYGGSVPPSPIWHPHSQGPHTLPSQGTRQYILELGTGRWGDSHGNTSWPPPNQTGWRNVQTYGSIDKIHVLGNDGHLCPCLF